jgi:hypothetical protein
MSLEDSRLTLCSFQFSFTSVSESDLILLYSWVLNGVIYPISSRIEFILAPPSVWAASLSTNLKIGFQVPLFKPDTACPGYHRYPHSSTVLIDLPYTQAMHASLLSQTK